MQLNANMAVVDRLFTAYSPADHAGLVNMRDALSEALRVSMVNTQLYTVAIDAELKPGHALSEIVHPWNLAAAIIQCSLASTAFGGPFAPAPDLAVWLDAWMPLHQLACPPLLTPLSPPVDTPEAVPEAPQPDLFQLAQRAQQAQAAVNAIVSPAQGQAAPQAASAPHGGAMPSLDVTRAVATGTGRSAKSPFDREYRPRERIGKMPSWWPGVVRYLALYASDDAVTLVPIENSPSPVMEYTMALNLAELALVSVPEDITVGELLAWIRTSQAHIVGSGAGAVAFDLVNDMSRQSAEYTAKAEAIAAAKLEAGEV